MNNIKSLIDSFQFEEPIHIGTKFTIIPLKSFIKSRLEYISLEEALASKKLTLIGVDNHGCVNAIIAINNSRDYILLVEGDVLVGSKQNRSLNTTILLEPSCKSKIPVSCIESGRWRFTSRFFSAGSSTIPHHLREMMHKYVKESLRRRRSYDANQSKMWSSIDNEIARLNLHSETNDMDFLIKEKIKEQPISFDEINLNRSIQGIVFFINSSLRYFEYFSRSEFYQKFYPRLIRELILDYDYYTESKEKTDINHIELAKEFF